MLVTRNNNTDNNSCDELRKFIGDCNSILVAAASDLASFSQYDIEAGYIVTLSKKAEMLENIAASNTGLKMDMAKISILSRELLLGIGKICHQAQQLADLPLNHQKYTEFQSKFDQWWLSWASN